MDLDEAARQLYAGSPEEFVGARTALVKQARKDGDKQLATAIGALRKPTRTAWLVNTLARAEPSAVGGLLDLGDELRTAQEQRDGATLRTLSARRRTAIDALVRQATTLGRDAGHPPTDSTLNEVAQTLQAALGDPDVAAQVRESRLAGSAVYGGFGGPSAGDASGAGQASGDDDLAAMLAASMPTARKATAQPDADTDSDADAEQKREAERRAELERSRDEARTALAEAQDAADRATEAADRCKDEVDRLRGELADAEQAERQARHDAKAGRDVVRIRKQEADAAEAAWRDVSP